MPFVGILRQIVVAWLLLSKDSFDFILDVLVVCVSVVLAPLQSMCVLHLYMIEVQIYCMW